MFLFALAACGPFTNPDGPVPPTEPPPLATVVVPPPPGPSYDAHYTQYINTSGIPIIGGDAVHPSSLERADLVVGEVFAGRPDVLAELVAKGAYVAVYALSEDPRDLPEVRQNGPARPWLAGTFGGNGSRLLMSYIAEDHVLCNNQYGQIRYTQDTLVHELGHMVHFGPVEEGSADFDTSLQAYDDAVAAGRWAGTYGGSTPWEYYAVGTQTYFGLPEVEGVNGNGIENAEDLLAYDPVLYDVVAAWFSGDPLPSSCAWQLRQAQLTNVDGERTPYWQTVEGTYDLTSPYQPGVPGDQLPADDPVRLYCARYPGCSMYGDAEEPACTAVLLTDRDLARYLDVPDYTLNLASCAEEASCYDYLACRYDIQYGAYPWTSDP
ncbi:MAG: hypothetical protein H6734_27090 [Alphaproteobacteria bacterium]|nr:hypothetical protein [Alphaproteobacteria bacterium]